MTSAVLTVSGLGKAYRTYGSFAARLASWFGASITPNTEFWAARDVSFSVMPGEAVALIGANGAGKSTLLKMITGTVRPTTGAIAVAGRISAILELGIGFNPELTGRMNVKQAGGLMGFTPGELERMIPDIESFAELGEYFDQPLRTYSSGMQARLAFSLATARMPEILIVDEVLSVGDSYFQHKSFDRIREFKQRGCSILLVTHGLGDVRALCDRVLLLDSGRVIKDAPPDEAVDYYNALVAERDSARLSIEQRRERGGWVSSRSGSLSAHVSRVALLDENGAEVGTARVGQRLSLVCEVEVGSDIPRLVLGLMIRDRTGHIVWGTNTWHTGHAVEAPRAGDTFRIKLDLACALGPGSYSFSTALCAEDHHLNSNYEWRDNLLVFDVVNVGQPIFIGTSALDARFVVERAEKAA